MNNTDNSGQEQDEGDKSGTLPEKQEKKPAETSEATDIETVNKELRDAGIDILE